VLGAAEGALRLLGIEAEDEREDPFYGLSPDYKLFKKTRLESGEEIYETNFNKQSSYDYFNFNYQTFPTPKAPGGFRVFTLGGSSVYGVPYGDKESFSRRLEGKLRAARAGRPIEVVNTGGAGYETERIRILVRELLDYEPDLFILYVGHNEFLNHFYRPGSADFAEKFSTARIYLNRIRLYALLRRPIVDLKYRLGRGGDAPDADDEEPTRPADGPLVQVLDGGVIRRKYNFLLDAYVRNLTSIVREAGARGVRVILATVGSNQLVPPNGSVHFKSLSPDEEKTWAEAYAAGADLYRWATEGGAANSWEATPEQRALLEEARAHLERAAAVDDTFAMLSFYRGQVYGRLGDWPRAREMFQRCLWEDARPNRAPMALNDAVRVVARVEGTAFVDAYAALAARAT
ncbi:MAG: hypothetical protein K8I02_02350, partial [Candidatus Methylomirabilis sp.]|nr:hypothetical protein [Deltaproteobacteria bacterium]